MSYISIVRGKIIETTGGSDTIYADNITYEARGTISQTGVKKGVEYSNNPKSPPVNTRAKCVVEYRPGKEWKGEFGIDWPRKADSKMVVDNNYNGIIGKYGKIYATEKGSVFTPDKKSYLKHLNEYSSFNCYKGKYYVPNLTLMQGETAYLDAITEVKESPDKLHYAHDESIFELTILKKLTSTKGKHFDGRAISIKCLKKFTQKQTIRIIATVGLYMEKVGEICILPNDKIKNVNVIFIPVTHNKKMGQIVSDELTIFKNAMNQAYIKPNIIKNKKDLIVGGFWFDYFFTKKDNNGNVILKRSEVKSIHSWLDDDFFKVKENDKYKDYYRIYMLNQGDINGAAADVGNNAKAVVVYSNRNHSTTPHEIMHAMGLFHTFDNDGLFTYKLYNTDNIIDYTHQVAGKEGFSTNKWQWKILNSGI
jgi:hypothetical protein